MPLKKRDYVQASNKDGSPKFEIGPHGATPVLIPITEEYEVVFVQNLTTGEITEQSTKAAAMFYNDRARFRFLEPKAGAKAYQTQQAGALRVDAAGLVNFSELEESPASPYTAAAPLLSAEGEELRSPEEIADENAILRQRIAALESVTGDTANGEPTAPAGSSTTTEAPKPATRLVKKEEPTAPAGS